MTWQLAQLNVARLRYPVEHPAISDFVDGLDAVNALAERSKGFIWRLQDDAGNATSFHLYDDPLLIINMSVWESVEALMRFVQSDMHLSFLKRRREWFEKPEKAYVALWWVPEGHQPTVSEARERLGHLRDKGPTAFAFSFRDRYPAPAADHRTRSGSG